MTDLSPIVRTQLPPLPDFLGIAQRVQNVANLLTDAQRQLEAFQDLRIINGDSLDDLIPVPNQDGKTPTYQERIDQLQRGMRALQEQHADIAEELNAEALKRRKAAEAD